MMSRSGAVILSLSLMSSLASSAFAGCGSSKPKAEQPQVAAETPRAPSAFCESFTGVYCSNDYDAEPGQVKQTTFDDLSADDKAALLAQCESAWEGADEKTQETMQQCVGCVADCSAAERCLDGTSTGCPDFGEEEPPSEE